MTSISVIVCPILFGIVFLIQTSYFLYKYFGPRDVNNSKTPPETTIPMTDCETTCCMGWAWTSCIDKTNNRMPLKILIIWYTIGTVLNVILTIVLFFVLQSIEKI